MSLHVNIGPKWTFGSHSSFGRRGYQIRSSRPTSSFLASSFGVNSRRLQYTSAVSHILDRRCLRKTEVPSGLCSAHSKRSSLASQHRAVFFTTSASHDDAVPTDVDVQDSKIGRHISDVDLSQLDLRATSDRAVYQTALNEREEVCERSVRVFPHDGSSNSVTDQLLSPTSDGRDGAAVVEGYLADGKSKLFKRLVPSVRRSRQLPKLFSAKLTQLGVLLSEKRDMKQIRDTFSDVTSVRDSLLHLHGTEIDRWLEGPWDSAKAMQVMDLLLGSIVTSPHQALNVLQNLEEIQHDFTVRCQCLAYIGHMYKDILTKHRGLLAKFDLQVKQLASPHLWPATEIRCRHLSLLLWRMNSIEAQNLIVHFLKRYPTPTIDACLYLAMYCSRNGMEPLAVSILTDLPSKELQSPSSLTLKCCQVLLRNDVVESTPDGPNFKFLPRLLEKGLTPDNVLYSRIIERALESGYPGVAWDIFRHLQATSVEITGWTYLVLLRHAFNENNVTGVQEMMLEIQQKEALYTNAHLLMYSMNIVRRIFHHEKHMTTAESLSHILALYDRVFSREPLVKLEIVPSLGSNKSKATSPRRGTAGELIKPDASCLSFTVWAYVLCNRSSKNVRTLWARLQALIDAGDATVVECMRLDLIYNAFIWLNLRERRTGSMAAALEILQYMLAKQLCVPTDRTWSILICGFLRCDQKAQAKRIYGLMKQCHFTMGNIRKEYWRRNWTFEYFEEHLEEILDEDMMPDGTEIGGAEGMRSRGDQLDYKDVTEKLDSDFGSSIYSPEVQQGMRQA